MQTRLRWLVLALCGLAAAAPAAAQETGSISGYTFDATGTAVPGVTITVTGAQLPGARTVTTSDNGFFQVPILLPGSYTVKASKAGVGDSQRTVIVEIARDSQVDLALGVTLQESVAVTAATPRVDLRSTEVNFNFSKELIDQLPLQRTYAGLFQLCRASPKTLARRRRRQDTLPADGVTAPTPRLSSRPRSTSSTSRIFVARRHHRKFGSLGFVTTSVTRSARTRSPGGPARGAS